MNVELLSRLKTTPKLLLDCENLSTISEVIEMSFSMSADVYSDLTIRVFQHEDSASMG